MFHEASVTRPVFSFKNEKELLKEDFSSNRFTVENKNV